MTDTKTGAERERPYWTWFWSEAGQRAMADAGCNGDRYRAAFEGGRQAAIASRPQPGDADGVDFETWASDEGLSLEAYDTQGPGPNFIDAETAGAYRGWHAALTVRAAPQQPEPASRPQDAKPAADAIEDRHLIGEHGEWLPMPAADADALPPLPPFPADGVSWSDWANEHAREAVRLSRGKDAEDAARYRWLRDEAREGDVATLAESPAAEWDPYIDAARAAAEPKA
jgi:hypothetical protein